MTPGNAQRAHLGHFLCVERSACFWQVEQACTSEGLLDLPDHLLHTVLATSWDTRPQRTASEEVRHALQLRGLSRGVSELLRARPLLLDLDFSDMYMSSRELVAWLASPAWTDCVEALTLRGWKGQGCCGDGVTPMKEYAGCPQCDGYVEDELEEGFDEVMPLLLDALRANQRRSLKRLFGVPLNICRPLSASAEAGSPEHIDVSAFGLTHLGVTVVEENAELEPLRLPPTLTSLVCFHPVIGPDYGHTAACWCDYRASYNAPRFCSALPRLTSMFQTGDVEEVESHSFPARGGEHVGIKCEELTVRGSVREGDSDFSLFPRAASVHVDTCILGVVITTASVEMLPDPLWLCPKSLEEAVFWTRDSRFPTFASYVLTMDMSTCHGRRSCARSSPRGPTSMRLR